MKKYKNYFVSTLGVLLIVAGSLLLYKISINYSMLLVGLGTGLLGVGIANIFAVRKSSNPEFEKLVHIQANDERNIVVRYKTHEKLYYFNIYALSIFTLAASMLNAPLWIILTISGILLLNIVLYIIIFNRYYKSL